MKLKPCPFCGCKKVELRIYDKSGWWEDCITCSYCGIGFSTGIYAGGISVDQVEEMSIEAWNMRKREE